jgi:trimeric autotransporter adhesin
MYRGTRIAQCVLACLASAAICQGQGIITTVAGSDLVYPGSSYSALSASFGQLTGVAVSPVTGDVYFASGSRSLIVKFNRTLNSVSVVAGIGTGGYSGDGGPAANAALNSPQQLVFDQAGNLYIADNQNACIRKIDLQGVITTVVKSPEYGATGLAFAPDGTIYFSDSSRIYHVSAGGTVSVVAGGSQQGFSGDGGPAANAVLSFPNSLVFDTLGNLLVADSGNNRIRRIGAGGIISTFAGNGQFAPSVDGPAAASPLEDPTALALDASGNIYIAAYGDLVIVDSTGSLSSLTPNHSTYPLTTATPLANADVFASGLAFDQAGNLYLTDYFASCLYRSSAEGTIQAVAAYAPSFGIGDNGPALHAGLNGPAMLGLLPDGSLLIADRFNLRIRRLSTAGTITTIAGTGSPADLYSPAQAIAGSAGNIDIATSGIEQLSPSGTVSFLNTDNYYPSALAFDLQGNLLFSNTGGVVERISPAGQVTLFAGNGQKGFSGDGGPAVSASLNSPIGLAVDSRGNVYIADTGNGRVRMVGTDGIITTFAGGGNLYVDGVPATQASIYPYALAFDQTDNLYVAGSNTVKKISVDGIISTFAGTGTPGFSGDGGPAAAATINFAEGLAIDGAGNVYISDTYNNRIREVLASPPTISVSSTQVTVTAFSNGAPTQASVTVTSPVQGLNYSITFSTSGGGDWLGFTSLQGKAPGVLPITVDPSGLQPGTYQGTVTLNSPNAAPHVSSISVTLNVLQVQPAVLALSAQSLPFALTTNSNPSSTQLTVSNQGSGAIGFITSASTVTGGAWLQVSQQSGTVGPASPANLTITANPGNLAPGSYNGSVTVASPDNGQQITVPATLAINPTPQKIVLSQTGLTFTAVAQGGAPIPQTFGILNTGSGSMTWGATANTLSGSGWLSISPTTGTVTTPFLDVSFVNVSVNAASLAAGTYYGNVQVTAPGASNSPQTVLVVLDVLPAGSNPGPQLSPTGLVFTGVAGAESPGSQSVSVADVTANATTYGSSVTYVGTSNWISYLPQNGTIQPGTPAQILVQPNFANLSTGVLRAALTLAFDDGSIRTVSILSVVAPTGTSSQSSDRLAPRASGCAPTKLNPVFTQLGTGPSVPTGFPVPIIVKVVDDCGNPLTSGSVVAAFSNGDAPLALIDLQNSEWSGTWVPLTASTSGVTVSITAELPTLNLTGTTQTTIGLQGNQSPPLLTSQPVSAATLQAGPLAPGELVVINGSSLADRQASSTTSPLPQQLAGASVAIGGQLTPLLYANNGQLVGIVPPNLPVNSSQQIVPMRDNASGIPSPAIVAATQPAVFTQNGSGTGQAMAYKAGILADSSNPVQPGDNVIIYSAGLGVVDSTGAATNPVSATIGGQAAQVSYAGTALAASFPPAGPPAILGVSTGLGGLYQINAKIPAGVSGGPAAVIISSAGQTSQQGVTLAIAGTATGTVPVISATDTAGGFPDIAQNDWIEVKGNNLASATMNWDNAPDFAQGKLPTQLGGVSVTVNGKPAFVYYISPTQINVLSPLDSTIGPVQIVVTSGGTPSAPFTADIRPAAPSFALFGTTYIAAQHADYSLLGPTSLGSAYTPARPGETVLLYAFGFGLPTTPLVNGALSQIGPLPALPFIEIGGAPAQVLYAGVAGPGLYQFNVTIPAAAANGDNAVICTFAGLSTPAGDLISVQSQ